MTYINNIVWNQITNDIRFQEMNKFMAHSDITCLMHVEKVAEEAYKFAKKHKINVNYSDLLAGALLHDYYLYDWHNSPVSWHGFRHNKIAMENAIRDFKINKRVQNIVYSHMFPLTFWAIPKTKEAWIVTMMDKKVATIETFRKYKNNVI